MSKDTPKRIAQLKLERPAYAHAAVTHYLRAKGESYNAPLSDTDLSDLLADLYHLADLHGFDTVLLQDRALAHYQAEKEEY